MNPSLLHQPLPYEKHRINPHVPAQLHAPPRYSKIGQVIPNRQNRLPLRHTERTADRVVFFLVPLPQQSPPRYLQLFFARFLLFNK